MNTFPKANISRRKKGWSPKGKAIFQPSIFLDYVNWLVLSDEQTSKRWQFSLLNDEQMSNKVGVKHQPVNFGVE